jgi:putative ABC transport system substrate-binding protein
LLAAGALALAAPRALGQSARAPRRVGIAFHSNPDSARPYLDAFVQGMNEQGWRLERDYVLEARYAQGQSDRYPAIMGELLLARAEVIVVGPNTGVQAAKALRADRQHEDRAGARPRHPEIGPGARRPTDRVAAIAA